MPSNQTFSNSLDDDPRVRMSRAHLANLDPLLIARALSSFYEYSTHGARHLGYLRLLRREPTHDRYEWHLQCHSETSRKTRLSDVEGLAFLVHEKHVAGLVAVLAEINPDQALALTLLLDMLIDRAATALDTESVDLV